MADDFMTGFIAGQADNDKNVCVVPANNGGGWGGNGSWGEMIFAIIILAMFAGGDGFGNGGLFGGGRGGAAGEVQRGFDTSAIVNKLDGINSGLCDGFYAMNTGMLNGFNGVQRDMCTGFAGINAGINATQVAMMQGFNAAQAQAADCCCKTQTNIMQLGNQVERGFCQTNFNDQANTTAIIQNAHNDTDRVLAKLDAMEMARKDETILALREKLSAADLAASQAAQNNYLVNQLRPCPIPAYISCNPWAAQAPYGSCYNQGCGCNSGCGC